MSDLDKYLAALKEFNASTDKAREEAALARESAALACKELMAIKISALKKENAALQAATDAAKAKAALDTAASTSSSSSESAAATAIMKTGELNEVCTGLTGITYPKWPEFDSSVKFNENDPAYTNGHIHALACRKVWQAAKEHSESVRDEHVHAIYNSIIKVHISTLPKDQAESVGFFSIMAPTVMAICTIADPLVLDKVAHVNATVE